MFPLARPAKTSCQLEDGVLSEGDWQGGFSRVDILISDLLLNLPGQEVLLLSHKHKSMRLPLDFAVFADDGRPIYSQNLYLLNSILLYVCLCISFIYIFYIYAYVCALFLFQAPTNSLDKKSLYYPLSSNYSFNAFLSNSSSNILL